MVKFAFLFPGQGSQYVGMGRSLLENFSEAGKLFDQANDLLGFDIKNIILNGPEEKLKETKITQPAIWLVSAAAYNLFKNRFSRTKLRKLPCMPPDTAWENTPHCTPEAFLIFKLL